MAGLTMARLLRTRGLMYLRSMRMSTSTSVIHSKLSFMDPDSMAPIPMYRVLGLDGHFIDPSDPPQIEDDVVMKMYRDMTRLNIMDTILDDCQQRGRITFYLTNFGEEGAQIASAAALNRKDLIFGQYREAGVLMWRGFPLVQFFHQCYGNTNDWGKGRQLPVHYGSREHGFVTISSTLATQMPQAAGSAYAFKRKQNGLCVMCYFGDGTSSEGDAHVGLNFASVLDCPVIFLCRNNGYAISTSTEEQFRGDGVASRGLGYGMTTIRVDGNDVFAVYNATREARKISVSQNRPVLIEAMTYRVGDHSTTFDSFNYRTEDEVKRWDTYDNPITRLRNYLTNQNLWDGSKEEKLQLDTRKEVMKAMADADSKKKGNPDSLFADVYDVMPASLKDQRDEMWQHVRQYKEHYPLENFEEYTLP